MIDDLVTRGRHRALSDVHQPRGVPPAPARRQCRPAADSRRRGDLGCVGSERARGLCGQGGRARRCPRRRDLSSPDAGGGGACRVPRSGPTASAAPCCSSWRTPRSASRISRRVWPQIASWPAFAREQIEIDAAYHGYLDRQEADVALFRRDEDLALPADLDYAGPGRPLQRGPARSFRRWRRRRSARPRASKG